MNKILNISQINRHLLKKCKDKLIKSNGGQDKSLTKEQVNWNKPNLINNLFQNQEEYRIRHLPIRKLKKDAYFVNNMAIKQIIAIDLRVNNIKKQREEFKIYLKFIAHQTEFLFQKEKFQPYQEAPKITDALRRYERWQVEFDFQELIRGQNKQYIRIYDPERPDEYDVEDF